LLSESICIIWYELSIIMKTSKIWKISKEEFQSIINESNSLREVLIKCGLVVVAGNYKTLQNRIVSDKVDLTKLNLNRNNVRKTWTANKISYSNEEVFIEKSKFDRGGIKRRIIQDNLLPYKCSKCGVDNKWMNDELVLVLDHINGVNDDHRLENLRFLCPNCNSQTSTFAGRNNIKNVDICPSCKKEYSGYGKQCKKCWLQNQPKKFNIDKQTLNNLVLIQKMSLYSIGKTYGVSLNTVKDRCKTWGIF